MLVPVLKHDSLPEREAIINTNKPGHDRPTNAEPILEVISKMVSQKDYDATEQDKSEIVVEISIMTHLNSSKVLQPGKQAFHLPTSFVATQHSSILCDRLLAVGFVGSNHLNALFLQPFIERVTVIGSVTDQSFRLLLCKSLLQSLFHQLHFMRRSTSNGYGERKTSAICHCHELCTLAPLGFSHPVAPFLAMTKLPSMKHSLRSRPPRSCTSFTRARKISSNTPFSTHSRNLLWQVWYGGYRFGMSCQGAPVRKTHKIPFRIARSSTLGRPLPSARRSTFGSKGSTTAHCSSLRSIGPLPT